MNGIAIDLGSAYSTVARVNEAGIPTLIADVQESDQFRTPSFVQFGATGPLVGQAAVTAASAWPESAVVQGPKAMLASGRTLAIDPAKKGWTAEECVGLLLSKLRQDASAHCFQSVEEAVLTVPSRFTSAQRHALRQAAEAVGLRVRALVEESLAAAVYAASQTGRDQTDREQTVLVVQAGRCGFEAAVVRCDRRGGTTVAARHDGSLCGKAIDQRLADEISRAQGWDRNQLGPSEAKQLLQFAEELKLALCQATASSSPADSHSVLQVQRQALVCKSSFDFILTHWHFQQLLAPMLERALALVQECVAEAGGDANKINRVVLAGGTAQLPALRMELAARLSLPPERIMNQDGQSAVAYGAALLAALPDKMLAQYDCSRNSSGDTDRAGLRGAARGPAALFDVGIRIGDPRSGQAAIYKLIKRGTALPAKASKQFRTSRAEQPRLIIEAVKTDGSIRRAESLGHFSLALPPGLPAGHPVLVTMHCDASGQICVEAESTPISNPGA